MSFADDLRKFAEAAPDRAEAVRRKVALELFRRVIMRTPVDTGRLRGNWRCTAGFMPQDPVDRESKDGGAPINEAVRVTAAAKDSEPLYLTNNLPYARPIEYGHSQQAPAGMVRVSIAEFQGIVEQAASE